LQLQIILRREISVYFTEPVCTKLGLVRQRFVKNSDTKFYENPTRGIVTDTTLRTDGRGSPFHAFFVLRGRRLIMANLREDYGSFGNIPTIEPSAI